LVPHIPAHIEGYWVAFKATKIFDFDAQVTVTVKAKVPFKLGVTSWKKTSITPL